MRRGFRRELAAFAILSAAVLLAVVGGSATARGAEPLELTPDIVKAKGHGGFDGDVTQDQALRQGRARGRRAAEEGAEGEGGSRQQVGRRRRLPGNGRRGLHTDERRELPGPRPHGLGRRLAARPERRRRPEPLRPDREHLGRHLRQVGEPARRVHLRHALEPGAHGHAVRQLEPGRSGRALRPVRRPLHRRRLRLVELLERAVLRVHRRLEDGQPGDGRLVVLRVAGRERLEAARLPEARRLARRHLHVGQRLRARPAAARS